jgi:hypothetical protein
MSTKITYEYRYYFIRPILDWSLESASYAAGGFSMTDPTGDLDIKIGPILDSQEL